MRSLLAVFAGVAAVLAAIGIYGVLACSVEQRTREIGVRMALGAQRRQVLAIVLRRGLALTLAGLALGTAAAAGSARVLESLLFGVAPSTDRPMPASCCCSSWWRCWRRTCPARRATRVDPLTALSAD